MEEVCPEMQSLRDKPSLPNLTFLSDERDAQIDALLREDRELKRRREEIKAEIETLGEDAKDRWYFQEYEREYAENARKAERQRQLRAKDEERKRNVNGRLANMTPEARAKWKSIIAGVKESTPEELKADLVTAAAKRRQSDPRRWRRNGSAEKGASE
jgi:hypothetical protein